MTFSVQEDQHKVSLEKEKSAQLKAEKDHEENCRQLQATAEEKYLMEQQLTELQQLVKKVNHQLYAYSVITLYGNIEQATYHCN